MPTVEESLFVQSPIRAALDLGVEQISAQQTITFTKYVKIVLPLDGFVFWVKADLLSASALFNAAAFNTATFDGTVSVITPAPTITIKGSFHHATAKRQNEDETVAVNEIVFTAEAPVQDFNEIGPTVLFLGTVPETGERYAFRERLPYYKQADLFHYRGTAVYPALASQIVDSVADFDSTSLVISNSLPIWLSLNGYLPLYPSFGNSSVMLYPSFALPDNLSPPYAAVHIVPESTSALQSAPYLDATLSHTQLVEERVRVTLYGLRNNAALDFVDCVSQFTVDTGDMGIMNMPVVRDEKRTQAELAILAMKKAAEFRVNYYQERANAIGRQLILKAIPTFIIADYRVPTAA